MVHIDQCTFNVLYSMFYTFPRVWGVSVCAFVSVRVCVCVCVCVVALGASVAQWCEHWTAGQQAEGSILHQRHD